MLLKGQEQESSVHLGNFHMPLGIAAENSGNKGCVKIPKLLQSSKYLPVQVEVIQKAPLGYQNEEYSTKRIIQSSCTYF